MATKKKSKAKLKLRAIQKIEEPDKAPFVRMVIDAEDAPPLPVEKIEEPVELIHPDGPHPVPDEPVLTWWQKLWR